jgi:hypothetical protein
VLNSVTDSSNAYQFAGDGTAAHPPLYDADLFTFLPYQVNASTFVIPYYVMTRNITQVYQPNATGGHQYDLPTETFSLNLSGVHGKYASVTVYDPINNVNVPFTITSRGDNTLSLSVPATDYPYLLKIQEMPPTAPTITSASNYSIAYGSTGTFNVTATGWPLPGINQAGLLPAGLTFVDHGDGTATISGIPTIPGSSSLVLSATNGVGSAAVQSFALNVLSPQLTISYGGILVPDGGAISSLNGTQFGQATKGSAGPIETFTLRNSGNAPLQISATAVSTGNFTVLQSPAATLAAGQTTSLTLQMQTQAVGPQNATFVFSTNDLLNAAYVIQLSGSVIMPPAPILAVAQDAQGTALPATVDFGSTIQSSSGIMQSVTLQNTGNDVLNIDSIDLPAGFVVTVPPPTRILPGDSGSLTLQVDTQTAGAYQGDVSINSDGGNALIPVSARVIPLANSSPDSASFLAIVRVLPTKPARGGLIGGTPAAVVPIRIQIQNTGGINVANQLVTGTAKLTLLGIPASSSLDSDQLALGTLNLRLKLKPGALQTLILPARFPSISVDGTYYIMAQLVGEFVPAANGIAAADPTSLNIASARVDLTAERWPDDQLSAIAGGLAHTGMAITNAGNIKSKNVITFEISVVGADDPTASPVTSTTLTRKLSIVDGATVHVAIPLRVPKSVPAGQYVLVINLSDSSIALADLQATMLVS